MPVRAPQFRRSGRGRPRRSDVEPPPPEKSPAPAQRPDADDRCEEERRRKADRCDGDTGDR